ncbi:MAG: ribonuclease D [Methylococcales bacterium]|nr:ribonuclease D [Methylococcales bacterium]
MTTIQYIDTPEQLEQLCQKIAVAPWIALDTEFLREKTYYPKFCLLQIATPEWVACIDPLAFKQLNNLFEVIANPKIIKVFHSCRQDLEIFYQLTGNVPKPVFDTQIAAPLLGIQDNPGYAMLVSTFLNVNLSKAYTRTDWSVRPLSPEQIQYAADDVIYLCQIYEIMQAKLMELDRFEWLEADFKALYNLDIYEVRPENAWQRIKGKKKLTGKQLSIVQSLTQWREQLARSENKPRNWLIRDDLIIELAKLQPSTVKELSSVRQINDNLVRRHGKSLCRLITEAKQKNTSPLKNDDKSVKKTQQQEALLDVLFAIVRIRADENSINPNLLASRKELEKLLFKEEGCEVLKGWRFGMVGKELQALLLGEYSLNIKQERLIISQVTDLK